MALHGAKPLKNYTFEDFNAGEKSEFLAVMPQFITGEMDKKGLFVHFKADKQKCMRFMQFGKLYGEWSKSQNKASASIDSLEETQARLEALQAEETMLIQRMNQRDAAMDSARNEAISLVSSSLGSVKVRTNII